jgi:N-acetylneuraminic acid mutarotase
MTSKVLNAWLGIGFVLALSACDIGQVTEAVENAEVEFSMHHTRFDSTYGMFQELTPPTVKRNVFFVQAMGDKVYVIGGLDEKGDYTSALESYDVTQKTWQRLADWPNPGFGFTLVVGDLLCAVGGFKNLDEPIRREVDCYDPSTDQWSARDQVPVNYAGFWPVSLGDKVYIFGGIAADWSLLDEAWVYDSTKDQWSQLAPLPFGFSVGGVVSYDNKFYLVGGLKGSSVDQAALDGDKGTDMLIYDVVADSWSTGPDMPHPRMFYGTDAIADHIGVFFGIGDDGPLAEFYDPVSGQWFAATDPVDGPEDGAYTYVRHQGQMHLFTLATQLSTSAVAASGNLWRYDFSADQWSVIGQRTEGNDALFSGASVGSGINFVGAHTKVTY